VGITSRLKGSHLVLRHIQKNRHKGGIFVYGALGRILTNYLQPHRQFLCTGRYD
jgi:hypothetical protein